MYRLKRNAVKRRENVLFVCYFSKESHRVQQVFCKAPRVDPLKKKNGKLSQDYLFILVPVELSLQ